MSEIISTKICPKCKTKKSLDDFFRNRSNASGRVSYCKKCARICQIAYHKTIRGRELLRKRANKYHTSEKGRKTSRIGMARYRRTRRFDPAFYLVVKAREAVAYAVRTGKLPSISTRRCKECGEQAQHYHHHLGYEKEDWLEVIPICAICHTAAHT